MESLADNIGQALALEGWLGLTLTTLFWLTGHRRLMWFSIGLASAEVPTVMFLWVMAHIQFVP